MKPQVLLKIASFSTAFFALGHSIGHFTRHQVTDPKALEIQKLMIENKFDMFGVLRSYDENYTGMSFNLIFTLIVFTILLWILSNNTNNENLKLVKSTLFVIMMCLIGYTITSYLYFFMVPTLTCLLASLLCGISIFKLK